MEACLAAGAQPAAPGEYTRRAFLNGKLGLTQAEAVMDIISASGDGNIIVNLKDSRLAITSQMAAKIMIS